MPPVKVPLGTKNVQKMVFIKVISGFFIRSHEKSYEHFTLLQEKKIEETEKVLKPSTKNIFLDKGMNGQMKVMNKKTYFEVNKQKSLKEKVKILKENMTSSLVLNAQLFVESRQKSIMSDIMLCKSARVLQKYGCLHKDPVNTKWRF